MNNQKIKNVAIKSAREAGEYLLKKFETFDRGDVDFKSNHEIVTKADIGAEEIILKNIKNNFPEHRILSEESGDTKKQSDYLWIVDPLDGTTNFSFRNPLWSVSIGVAFQGEIILGVIFAPFLNEMFVAESGQGSVMIKKGKTRKIKTSKMKDKKVLNTFCHGSKIKDIKRAVEYHKKQKINNFDCRQLGSAAIELAYVACGRVESIVIPGANSWDVAAGVLLVREAGGRVTDLDGSEWNLRSKDMLASNGLVHKQILSTLKKC